MIMQVLNGLSLGMVVIGLLGHAIIMLKFPHAQVWELAYWPKRFLGLKGSTLWWICTFLTIVGAVIQFYLWAEPHWRA